MTDNKKALDEVELGQISGGKSADMHDSTLQKYKYAGVITDGTHYFAEFSNGIKLEISESGAKYLIEYFATNKHKPSDKELLSFIHQYAV